MIITASKKLFFALKHKKASYLYIDGHLTHTFVVRCWITSMYKNEIFGYFYNIYNLKFCIKSYIIVQTSTRNRWIRSKINKKIKKIHIHPIYPAWFFFFFFFFIRRGIKKKKADFLFSSCIFFFVIKLHYKARLSFSFKV